MDKAQIDLKIVEEKMKDLKNYIPFYNPLFLKIIVLPSSFCSKAKCYNDAFYLSSSYITGLQTEQYLFL